MKNFTGNSRNSRLSFDTKIHTEQISAYLPMLNERAIGAINASQRKTDSVSPLGGGQFKNEFHFDNNKIWGSTQQINQGYRAALDAINGDNPEDVFLHFGRITHALQDFYSHSNWLGLLNGGWTVDQRLLDEGYGFFQELSPLKSIRKTKIVALEKGGDSVTEWGTIVNDWKVNTSTHVVSTTTDRGEEIAAMMTGEVNGALYGKGHSVPFVDSVTGQKWAGFDHGGIAGKIFGKYLGPLAKDHASDQGHEQALELARDQVQHELIRLLSLIHDRHGDSGLQRFQELFIRDGKQDEFSDLIRKRSLRSGKLKEIKLLNTIADNAADDLVLQDFYKDGITEITPDIDKHELPKNLEMFSEQIEAGDFRWDALSAPGPASGNLFNLEVKDKGEWSVTGFTSDDLIQFR